MGLEIVDPEDGQTITLADDVDDELDGIQYDVEATVRDLPDGEEVSLYLDLAADGPTDTDEPIATAAVMDAGVVFAGVTLPAGEHDLRAVARDGGVVSPRVSITVIDSCATISFVSPMAPSGDELTLGPAADVDGEACGATFATDVVVSTDAGDGQTARVFVNGSSRGEVTVDGMVASFDGVVLDNRGDTPNTLAVEVVNRDGVACRQDFPTEVFVDCEGLSCALTEPDSDSAFLNADDDTSDTEGFQTDFVVSTDAEGVGENMQLVIDGDDASAREAEAISVGDGAEARFAAITLSEGLRRAKGVCFDSAGNRTESGVSEWTVDITPCTVTIDDIAGGADPVTDLDDLDDTTDGIQVEVEGSVSGDACTTVRVGPCGTLAGGTLTGGAFTETVTLGSSAMQEICVEVEDEAGNVGEAMTTVNVRTDSPQVEIVSPSTGTEYNNDGSGGRTADLTPASDTCEAAFTVNCTDVGTTVDLVRQSSGIVLASADCVAMGGLPSPYAGQATYSSVSLPSQNSGGTLAIVARQTAAGLVGLSSPISVQPDCDAPEFTVVDPSGCPDVTLRPAIDDQDTSTAGLQHRVSVVNTNPTKPAVDLVITETSGGTVVYSDTSSTPATGPNTVFASADFGMGGMLEMDACGTDPAGNVGCAPTCNVLVADLPYVSITDPGMGDVLTSADDCDGSASGLQVQVTARTDAAAGSDATVQIGAGTPVDTTVMSGSPDNLVSVCIDAADARDVTITVTVDDSTRGSAAGMITGIDIDTMAPTTAIEPVSTSVIDRRGGDVRFSWTAVDDAGGFLLEDYVLRCADAPITTEGEWSAATMFTTAAIPASGGTAQSDDISGFRPEGTLYCVLRGIDAAGSLTPLPSSGGAEVTLPLMETEVTDTGTTGLGETAAPIGDVNGDSIDDVLVGSTGGSAYLYFGSTSGLGSSPDVELIGDSTTQFGRSVAGLGDVNGDGRPDFAVGARVGTSLGGAVYVFFGRDSGTSWPAAIDLTGACTADICLTGTEGGLFGWDIASADFNGDGFQDIVVGAPLANTFGRAYVILGSSGFTSGSSFDIPGSDPTMAPDGFYIAAPSGDRGFGRSVASPGDIGSDGLHDIAIGSVGHTPTSVPGALFTLVGRAYPGAAMGLQSISSASATRIDTGAAGRYAAIVRVIGDYDGNARVDLAVEEGFNTGRVFVYLQTGSGFSSSSRLIVDNDLANAAGDDFGTSLGQGWHPWLGPTGDVDGDGRADLLVGSDERSNEVGSVDLFYGESSPGSEGRSAAELVIQPTTAASAARRSGAFAGDLNGDGFPDILVGDESFSSGAGRFLIYY